MAYGLFMTNAAAVLAFPVPFAHLIADLDVPAVGAPVAVKYVSTIDRFQGSKFQATKGMDLRDIAKMVRSEIKTAIKSGALPAGIKASVTIDRYSGGQSLRVKLSGIDHRSGASFGVEPKYWLTRDAYAAESLCDEIVSAYNRTERDAHTDYSNARFYSSIVWA